LRSSSLQGTRLTVPSARAAVSSRRNCLIVKASQLLGGKKVNKVVLAYSGGLDTSVILTWLKETYDCEVVTFTADLGQGEELEPARKRAEEFGVKEIYIDDLRLMYYGLQPDIKVIAPWREWELNSRSKLISYAEKNNIPVPASKRGEPPFSMDANLLHISYEGNALEDPWEEAREDMYTRSVSPEQAPDKPTYIDLEFEGGNPVAIDGQQLSPASLLTQLNKVAGENGIGRIDIVESRFVGMKSRGVYETPGGTVLLAAHRAMESICLDRGEMHLKDELMPKYAELIYNGFWFSPEREALQAAIDVSQKYVSGTVRLKLYKGNTIVVGRKSPNSLYNEKIASFEDDEGLYDQKDAAGFIKLQALRLRTLGSNRMK
ncbi:MAG: argininosuccinate synthase, partial [Trebouxia sp. A1-2]